MSILYTYIVTSSYDSPSKITFATVVTILCKLYIILLNALTELCFGFRKKINKIDRISKEVNNII